MYDPIDLAPAVAEVVSERRHAAGLTLEDLAARAELHRTTLGLVERGGRRLSLTSAARIATALGMSTSELVALGEARLTHR